MFDEDWHGNAFFIDFKAEGHRATLETEKLLQAAAFVEMGECFAIRAETELSFPDVDTKITLGRHRLAAFVQYNSRIEGELGRNHLTFFN